MENFCSQCGASITADAKFCTSCGTPVSRPGQPPTPPQQPAPPTAANSFNHAPNEPHSQVITHETPGSQATIEFRDLHPNAIWLFALSYLIKTAFLLLLFAASAIFAPLLAPLLAVGYLVVLYLAAKITYKNFQFEVTDTGFSKIYGILHKYTANIPFDRIQNVNIRRSVIDRMLGLAHVEIETAGTGGSIKKDIVGGISSTSEGYIPGVSPKEATELRKVMLARAQKIAKKPAEV